jgi:pyruvate,water dikinase
MSPLPGDLAGQASLREEEVRYICERAAAIESAAGGVPQDVEWAIAKDLPFPDGVFFLQHRPETTWTSEPPADQDAETARPAFDPVQYALRNVFKVPGT